MYTLTKMSETVLPHLSHEDEPTTTELAPADTTGDIYDPSIAAVFMNGNGGRVGFDVGDTNQFEVSIDEHGTTVQVAGARFSMTNIGDCSVLCEYKKF